MLEERATPAVGHIQNFLSLHQVFQNFVTIAIDVHDLGQLEVQNSDQWVVWTIIVAADADQMKQIISSNNEVIQKITHWKAGKRILP